MDINKYVEDSCVERFIKAAKQINTLNPSIDIDYGKYIAEYTKASKTLLPLVAKLKLKDFIFLCTKFPNFDFTFEGRLKSEYSYFNKIIKSYIDNASATIDNIKFNPNSFLYDIFAFRIILNSISFNIDDSFSIIDEKKTIYKFVTSQCDEQKLCKINEGDVVQFSNGISITITKDNVIGMNDKVYVITENGNYLHVNGSQIIKKDRFTLTQNLYTIQDALSQFYKENNFEELDGRYKDYVKNPKRKQIQFKTTIPTPTYLLNEKRDTPSISNLRNLLSNTSPDIAIARLQHYGIFNNSNVTTSKGKPLPCYQSLHQGYCYKPYNVFFENQIRTVHMHNVAEYSPIFGHDVYKSNRIDENSLSKLPTFITYSKKIVRGKPEYSYTIHDMEYSVKKSFGIELEEFYNQYNNIHSNIEEIDGEPEI